MNIKDKLKYIQEGYSFSEIVSDTFTHTTDVIKENTELFMESFTTDIGYMIEMGSNMKTQATFFDHIKNVLKWIREKVMQFIRFVKQKLFSARKGTKETAKNIKAAAVKMEEAKHKPAVHSPKHEEPHPHEDNHDTIDEEEVHVHRSGAMEYSPEDHEITVFSKIFTNENFFDAGFKKVYDALNIYITKIEQNPNNHEQVISVTDVVNTKPFLNKIFKQTLSVDYDRMQIFKKIYGEFVTRPITVKELMILTDKLYKLDDECTVFAEWIQQTIPKSLDIMEDNFNRHMNSVKEKLIKGDSSNFEADREAVEILNDALAKVSKLINMQMSVIQVFAQLHAEVFTHIKDEISNYDWVLNPNDNYDYDNDGIYH